MKLLLFSTVLVLPYALAMPPQQPGQGLDARDNPKLNQYRTLEDCHNDKDILFHAAPTLGNCYDLDEKTGAFFYNTAFFLNAKVSKIIGCNGDSMHIKGGECMKKDDWKSVVFQ